MLSAYTVLDFCDLGCCQCIIGPRATVHDYFYWFNPTTEAHLRPIVRVL